MKKILLAILVALTLVACDDAEQAQSGNKEVEQSEQSNGKKEKELRKTEQKESRQEPKQDSKQEKDQEQKQEPLRELDKEELELWTDTDIPYLLDKHDIIESIEWNEFEVSVNLKEEKVTGIVEDKLFDSTNQIGKDLQEIIGWNYDIKDVPVNFYSDNELVSKQNKHGIWINFKMSNWENE